MKRLIALLLMAAMLSLAGTALAAEGAADAMELYNAWETNGYPDDVGGVYFDNATGKLVITLVGADEARKAEIAAMVKDTAGFSLGESQYAHNEMLAVKEEIEAEMRGNGKIYSVGIGWRSVNGEIAGFGESGKETRVIVTVDASALEEYEAAYEARYGDIVYVEAGEAPVTVDSKLHPAYNEAAGASGNGWLLPAAAGMLVLAGIAAVLYQRRRLTPVMETVAGTAVTSGQRLSRREVVQAVKQSAISPSEDAHDKLMERIDRTKS